MFTVAEFTSFELIVAVSLFVGILAGALLATVSRRDTKLTTGNEKISSTTLYLVHSALHERVKRAREKVEQCRTRSGPPQTLQYWEGELEEYLAAMLEIERLRFPAAGRDEAGLAAAA